MINFCRSIANLCIDNSLLSRVCAGNVAYTDIGLLRRNIDDALFMKCFVLFKLLVL